MFTGELAESRQTEVVIRDIDERAMELLIDFAYTSQVAQFITHKKKMPKLKKKKYKRTNGRGGFVWWLAGIVHLVNVC